MSQDMGAQTSAPEHRLCSRALLLRGPRRTSRVAGCCRVAGVEVYPGRFGTLIPMEPCRQFWCQGRHSAEPQGPGHMFVHAAVPQHVGSPPCVLVGTQMRVGSVPSWNSLCSTDTDLCTCEEASLHVCPCAHVCTAFIHTYPCPHTCVQGYMHICAPQSLPDPILAMATGWRRWSGHLGNRAGAG